MNRKSICTAAALTAAILCAVPVYAEGTAYVTDEYGVISSTEVEELNLQAEQVAAEYECGVYVKVVNSMGSAYNIDDYAESVYKSEDLGYGTGKNGVMLIIAMESRDYDIVAYGDTANYAFTDYAKSEIAADVVSKLSDGDYYSGFSTFIADCEEDLMWAANGSPVDTWIPDYSSSSDYYYDEPDYLIGKLTTGDLGLAGGLAAIISLIFCLIQRGKNKTAKIAVEARGYIAQNGIRITRSHDMFINRTITRTPIVHDTPNRGGGGGHMGGTSVNSGGFSHHSGKF